MEEIIYKFSIGYLLTLFGSSTIIATGVSAWIGSLIIERFRQNSLRETALEVEKAKKEAAKDLEIVKKAITIDIESVKKNGNLELEYYRKYANSEIENLKGDITRNNTLINTLLGQHGQAYQKVLDKRIDSSQKLWHLILEYKSTVPTSVSMAYDIFTDEEIREGILDCDKGLGAWGADLLKINNRELSKLQNPIFDNIVKLRPFLSLKLSQLGFVYGAIMGRMSFILTESYKEGKPRAWVDDDGIKQLLKNVLEPAEIDYIYNKIQATHYSTTVNILETKIVNEINIMLSGDSIVNDAIIQVEKWNSMYDAMKEQLKRS
ncbi:hypothetical protein [Spirosoma rigui]|uniref:hypothetical protein n=1 Tax=Spirosoma rigui TaxID=564064 RepID=UPI0012D2BC45|nr:hypothetical protein [Spirosoma rigui]